MAPVRAGSLNPEPRTLETLAIAKGIELIQGSQL
jgi:hypothetical protein